MANDIILQLIHYGFSDQGEVVLLNGIINGILVDSKAIASILRQKQIVLVYFKSSNDGFHHHFLNLSKPGKITVLLKLLCQERIILQKQCAWIELVHVVAPLMYRQE